MPRPPRGLVSFLGSNWTSRNQADIVASVGKRARSSPASWLQSNTHAAWTILHAISILVLLLFACFCFVCRRIHDFMLLSIGRCSNFAYQDPCFSAPAAMSTCVEFGRLSKVRYTFTHTHIHIQRARTDVLFILGGRQALVAGAHGCVGQVGLRWSSQLACP